MNVQGYISLIQQARFQESVELIRKSMPFPAICGRVCFSPCQDACTRKEIDKPVGIRFLKRLAADIEREQGRVRPNSIPKTHVEKVAIIGAGPSGLTAAYQLAKLGYPITIFERLPEAGGMMRFGIPDHRLQKYVVRNEIAYIKDLGVEIKNGVDFGKDLDIDTLRSKGYKAIFIAIGAQQSRKIGVLGEDLPRVFHAIEFLRSISQGEIINVGRKVAVIGGGNSAIDSARTTLRLGADNVTVFYRRSRQEMPALPHEVEAAEEEGVKFEFLVSPRKIIEKSDKTTIIEFSKMKLGEPDISGRKRPIPIQGSEFNYRTDTVICAIGQLAETSCIPNVLLEKNKLWISVDPQTLETKIPGIFAGGDVATGPASVIKAVAAGKRAAESIDRYLNGRNLKTARENDNEEFTWVKDLSSIHKKPERYRIAPTDFGKSNISFEKADVLLTKIKITAMLEARRCLECGPCAECLENEGLCDTDKAIVDEKSCVGCNICAVVCPFGAISKNENEVAQVDNYLCKGCGICSANCPEQAISMKKHSNKQILTKVALALRRNLTVV